MKRPNSIEHSVANGSGLISKKILDLDIKFTTQYNGYYPEDPLMGVDEVEVPKTEQEQIDFFTTYIIPRKPCKIIGLSPNGFPIDELKFGNIKNFLDEDEILQIEKKADGGFGSGNKRLKMSFGSFIDKLVESDETDLYLTTQYYEDDPDNGNYSSDEEEKDQVIDASFNANFSDTESLINVKDLHDDFDELEPYDNEEDDLVEDQLRIRELYQPPMANLVGALPETPDFLKYLIPQQINLWIGATSIKDNIDFANNFQPNSTTDRFLGLGRNIPGDGSSSGLHHDHADNIYIPIDGHKRFTLFSPGDAGKMYTAGDIRQIHETGIIDYIRNEKAPNWRELRDDGAIVAEVYKQYLEEEKDLDPTLKEKYEQIIELDFKAGARYSERDTLYLDPPSFSTIPPAFVHLNEIEDEATRHAMDKVIDKKWPLFKKANRMTVDLKPGEMLYLPTGWFHEVTSYGNENKKVASKEKANNIHVAVNYWFIPPNGSKMDNVYSNPDRYWPNDYVRTEAALSRNRE